ncbi:MAG TPA: sodium:calcium antiporter [Burkholderiaceae bacterium]|nr:sodium:calcium antiporter [Burkholderiaceae bacterium]
MTSDLAHLAIALLVILAAAEIFTNALEHVGQWLRVSEGVTGSIFAAVGTALPETMVPMLAIMAHPGAAAAGAEIGIGAILGASLMLSTLSTCLMALAVAGRRGLSGRLQPERSGFVRDLDFFLASLAMAGVAMFVPAGQQIIRAAISFALILTYFIYILLTIRASMHLVRDGHGTTSTERLFLTRIGLPRTRIVALLQLGVALLMLVAGAELFIDGVQGASRELGVSPLILSLLVVPIATELPEKVNSVLWARRGKDTLAVGNITGAMVFQGTLLPALGILLTPWQPRLEVVASAAIAFAAAAWLRLNAGPRGPQVGALLVNGVLYVGYVVLALTRT